MGSAAASASRFGSGFFEPVSEDRLGMCCGPAVGQHLFQTRIIRVDAEQKLADVDSRLDPVTLGEIW